MLDDLNLLGNSAWAWLFAISAGLGVLLILRITRSLLIRSLRKLAGRTTNQFDDVLASVIVATRGWVILLFAVGAASTFLVLPEGTRVFISRLLVIVLLFQIGTWGVAGIRAYVGVQTRRSTIDDAASITTVRALGFLATLLLWAVLVLVALDNMGINITALVAGLGIGGVAVALAVQNILGDLFASLSIVLDKPFVYGDFIVVDDLSGTVENVGLKTTRVRSITGEQLVFSNSDLLQSRIRNYKRMQERRVVVKLGVVHGTPIETLRELPRIIREIVEAQPDLRFDRSHFRGVGEYALTLEFVYFVLSADYGLYMDRQQTISLAILERFTAMGVDFAFPTHTVHFPGLAPGGQPSPGPIGRLAPETLNGPLRS